MANVSATEEDYIIPKAEIRYELWARLTGENK